MSWKQFKMEVKKQKDAILAGGVVGLATSYYLLNIKGVDISFAVGRTGLIDSVMSSTPEIKMAIVKVYLVFMILGMISGYIIGTFFIKKKGTVRRRATKRRRRR